MTDIKKGDDYGDLDIPTYGIHVGDHGNAIEVHGDPELRDRILSLLTTSPDLNQLSDEALRLALARALTRNAHLESLIASIGERVAKLDDWVLDMSAEQYAAMCPEYDSVEAYLDDQSWVLEQREDQDDGETPYPYEHECPFFSERFLYTLFGKEDARTILALFNQVRRLAEEDDSEMKRRRERKEELVRYASYILRDQEALDRIDKYLDPEEKWMNHRTKSDDELRADREKLVERMLNGVERLAQTAAWFDEDL